MESSYTIKIPKQLSMKTVDELYRAAQNLQVTCGVIFDFSDVAFVTPESLIFLVTASRFFKDRFGCGIEWKNIVPSVLGYMDRMRINDLDFIDIKRPFAFKRKSYGESDVLVELTVIKDADQIGSAILQTKRVLNRWFPDSQRDCKRHLLTLIKETVENSIEHSSTIPSKGFCYYVLQKYNRPGGITEVQIAVGDIGIGMLSSQRRMHPLTKDDAEAITAALMNGKSGRETGCGGMGYVSIRDALAPLNGQISIRSGRAHLEHTAGAPYAKIYRHSCGFPGTQIVFVAALDNRVDIC